MKTIPAPLTTAQKAPDGRPIASASLADSGALHPVSVAAQAVTGGNTLAAACGSFYLRIRYTASGLDKLDYQKITDPSVASQWTTWTNLIPNNVAHPRGIAVFWTGAYAVICWQDLASGDIKYKRSTDGASWSGAATAYATTGVTKIISGVSGGSTSGGIALTYGAQLYWGRYSEAANTWTAVSSAGAVFISDTPEVCGCFDAANDRHVFAVAVTGYKTWTSYALVLYVRTFSTGAWDGGRVLYAQSGTTYSGPSFSQGKINSRWWLSFYRNTLWNVVSSLNHVAASSDDGLFWSDPLPTALPGNERTLDILPAAGGWSSAYYSTERAAYRLDSYSYWSGLAVRSYQWAAAIGGSQAARSEASAEARPELLAVVDNRQGQATTPRLYSVFTLNRGYLYNGVQYTVSAGAWYVVGFRYIENDQFLEIEAVDARGLLASWVADNAHSFRLDTVKVLVERICALAGVHTVTFDSFAGWTDTISAFTHPAGENALYSLRSLAERVPFEYIVQADGSLAFYVCAASPAAGYTFGAGGHAFWPGAFGAAPSTSYIQIIGSPPRNRVTEHIDQSQLDALGRSQALLVNDRRITVDADGAELGNALLIVKKETKRAGQFSAPPAFGLEPGDVVGFAGSLYAASNGPWRVERVFESFNQPGPRRLAHGSARGFYQTITLRGTA